MAEILLQSRRIRQPGAGIGPDWSHPFLSKVLAFVDPISGLELVTKTPVVPKFGSEKIAAAPSGIGFYCGNNAKWTFTPKTPPDITNNRSISIFALTTIIGAPSQSYAGIVGTQSPNQSGLITAATATNLLFYWANLVAPNNFALANGQTVAAFMRSNTLAASTLQGNASATHGPALLGSGAGSAGALSFPATWEIGGDTRASYGTSRYLPQILHFAVVVNDYWSQSVFDSLVLNPWQLYKPQTLHIPISSGALPTLSLPTYTPGTLTSTGFGMRCTAS